MVRVLLYILIVVFIGAGFAWLANNPGDLVMTFGATRVTVSFFTAVILFVVLLIVALLIIWLLRVLFTAPRNVSKHFAQKRQKKGQEALSSGLLAVLSGDLDTARRMNKRVTRYIDSDHEPLVKLMEAQTLLLENDIPNAIRVYEEMSKNPKTRLIGLNGLFREAMKSGAYEAAGQYAEQATHISPTVKWANRAMLNRLSAEGDWDKAIELFDREIKALPRVERTDKPHNHQRVVLLTGQAMEKFENYPDDARKIALKAQKLEPDFVPATIVAADILYKLHEVRKADKLIEALWRKSPHPDLADVYLTGQERAVDRLKKARKLASDNPNQFESCMVLARAAFDAGELPFAREQAGRAAEISPRESAYLLLADIEEVQSGDQGKVRQWLSNAVRAQRDPVWMADGVAFEKWQPVSPLTGKLDAFEWKVPAQSLADSMIRNESHKPVLDVTTIKNAGIDDFPHQKSDAKPADSDFSAKQKTLAAEPVLVVDAVDPSKPDYAENMTRINVDDPGVYKG